MKPHASSVDLVSSHPSVHHPTRRLRLIRREFHENQPWIVRKNDQILDWFSEHVLASIAMFDFALIVPLIVIPMSTDVKVTLGVVSGSWIQWWALPALQRSQMRADRKREAKADADHEALTHIATSVDEILRRLEPHGA